LGMLCSAGLGGTGSALAMNPRLVLPTETEAETSSPGRKGKVGVE